MPMSRLEHDRIYRETNLTPEELMLLAEEEQAVIDAEMAEVEMNAATPPGDNEDDGGEMDPDTFNNAVSAAIEAAERLTDDLSDERELAGSYYRGEKFGGEDPDSSGVVMTEVRDTILTLLPQFIKIFCGTVPAVEFLSSVAVPKKQADHQTAYVGHIVHNDNDGFSVLLAAFKDALLYKTGVFTWWVEQREMVLVDRYTGIDEAAFALLQMDEAEDQSGDEVIESEINIVREVPDTMAIGEEPDLTGQDAAAQQMALELGMDLPPPNPPQNFIRDVEVVKRVIRKRIRVAAVPPEELLLSPTPSTDLDEFALVGRRQIKTIGELVALGYDEEKIREAVGDGGHDKGDFAHNGLRSDRMGGRAEDRLFAPDIADADPSLEEVKFCEIYLTIDYDGDGIPERRHIVTVGDTHNVILNEYMEGDMVPFSTICPDPEPHSPFGYSIADQTMDLQEVKSEIVRGILDSLAEAIIGRTEVVEGRVNLDDALSPARNQLVRVKEPGSIRTISKTFVGQQAIPLAAYVDEIKARRTGITLAPSGLDAQALQSTSNKVAESVVDSSQDRAVMIARIFAETGIKRMYRGLVRLAVKHQDKPRAVRLNGAPITVDPRTFAVDLDLQVNVGLGSGNSAKRMQALMAIIGQQKEVVLTYGLNNPLVPLDKLSNALEDFVHEAGFADAGRYMNIISPEQARGLAEKEASQPPKPTPEELLYKANQEKLQAEMQKAMLNAQSKMAAKQVDDAFRRDQLDVTQNVKQAEMLGKFGLELEKLRVQEEQQENASADALANDASSYAERLANPQSEGGERNNE